MLDPRPFIKPLAITVATALIWSGGFLYGHKQASQAGEAKLQSVKLAHAQDMQYLANAKAAELGAALAEQKELTDQAHRIGWELIQTRARLADTQHRLKQRIADATRSDGPRFTGLGPDSLRLYQSALGYRSPGDPGMPTADAGNADQAGQTTGADEGLPPEDLLAHSADYGEWCQKLDGQLDTWINLHERGPR